MLACVYGALIIINIHGKIALQWCSQQGKKHDNIKRAGNNQSAKIKIKSENIHEEKKKSITKS